MSLPPRTTIPLDSVIFGYGPMLPFAAGAIGSWATPALQGTAIGLTIIWGALILSFVGGVRRGFGFGEPSAATRVEIATMAIYVSIAGLALIFGWQGSPAWATGLLAAGFAVVVVLDSMAARAGNAPAHFTRLRGPQMGVAVVSLLILLARIVTS
jgi:hypothetical protein